MGSFVILCHQILGNSTRKAGGQGDQALVMLFQQFQIYSGFSVKAMHKRFRNHQAKIFITSAILAQQYKMVRIIVNSVDPVRHPAAGNINLTADDRFHTGSLRRLIKINTAIHDTVVRNGNGILTQLLYPVHHAVYPACSVKEAVFCMNM
jgi:hypothetical protein